MSNGLLVVVNMQNDFVTGALGSKQSEAIVNRVIEKIDNWDGLIFAIMDTHDENAYRKTKEGIKNPSHCIRGTEGWMIHEGVKKALKDHGGFYIHQKFNVFGANEISNYATRHGCDSITFVGLYTDVCVISNALMLRSMNPFIDISVDARCCAGTTKYAHEASINVMKNCCIDIL